MLLQNNRSYNLLLLPLVKHALLVQFFHSYLQKEKLFTSLTKAVVCFQQKKSFWSIVAKIHQTKKRKFVSIFSFDFSSSTTCCTFTRILLLIHITSIFFHIFHFIVASLILLFYKKKRKKSIIVCSRSRLLYVHRIILLCSVRMNGNKQQKQNSCNHIRVCVSGKFHCKYVLRAYV